MNVRRICLWVFLVIVMAITVSASDGGIVNTNISWFADIYSGAGFYDADHANITIYCPNTSTYISEAPMSEFQAGRFNYTFTPNVTGNWYAYVEFYNTTAKVATASQSMEIREEDFMTSDLGLAFINIIGLALFMGVTIFISFVWLKDKNDDKDKTYISHKFMRIITGFFLVFMLILIPRAILDATGSGGGNTQITFFTGTTWYIYVFMTYWIVYITIYIFRQWEILPKFLTALRNRR